MKERLPVSTIESPREIVVFEEKPLIKNSIVERMFMRIASDEWMKTYNEKATSDVPAIKASATAYASTKVERLFDYLTNSYEKQGGSLDELNSHLWNK